MTNRLATTEARARRVAAQGAPENHLLTALLDALVVSLEENFVHGQRRAEIVADFIETAMAEADWQPAEPNEADDPWTQHAFRIVAARQAMSRSKSEGKR